MPTRIITDREEARKTGLLKTAIHFVRTSDATKMYLPVLRYDYAIDLGRLLQYRPQETEALALPTLSNLLSDGLVTEEKDYREHDISPLGFEHPESAPPFTGRVIREIIGEFAQNGFPVTWEALVHNFCAWYSDRKSGFRDEKNGYFLFSPCGCNPLSFTATTLCEEVEWQETYEA